MYDPIQGIVDAAPGFLRLPVSWIGAGIYPIAQYPAQTWVPLTGVTDVTGEQTIPPVLNPFI